MHNSERLLASFLQTFFGFGTYGGRYWFVGMEEGGDPTLAESLGRIARWGERGEQEIEDLAGHRRGNDATVKWFRERPPIEPTWGKLIRLLLAAEGHDAASREAVRAYQRDRLGADDGETCLLELLPLPSRSSKAWIYGGLSSPPDLSSKETYRERYAPARAEHLKQRVQERRPTVVVFYSADRWYRRWWELIADAPFAQVRAGPHSFDMARNGVTTFAIVKHPATKGLPNAYFEAVGRAVRLAPLAPF
jgi:hypothetical protein